MADSNGRIIDEDPDELPFVRLSEESELGDVEMHDADSEEIDSPPEPSLQQPNGVAESRDLDDSQQGQNGIGDQTQTPSDRKFIVAVDFGTTTSSIAFLCVDQDTPEELIPPQRIQCIDHYPDTPPGVTASAHVDNTTVPTELWYEVKPTTKKDKNAGATMLGTEPDDGYDSPLDDGAHAPALSSSDHEQDPSPSNQTAPSRKAPIWGYGAQQKAAIPDTIDTKPIHMARFKLLLDESPNVEDLRHQPQVNLKALKFARIVGGPVDPIADYLEALFKHTRGRLINFHGLQDNDPVQFVLCVPTTWTEKACRVMQDAMMRAIKASQLGRLENGGIKDLFIVSEPEAAAAWALSEDHYASRIYPGETFLVLDCGGGTVDAITYQLLQTDPVRVREVVEATGESCGSSLLNEEFRKLLEIRLENAKLHINLPLPKVIDSAVLAWENGHKRQIDVTKRNEMPDAYIAGLERDDSQRIGNNRVHFEYKEMKDVFKGCLRKVVVLMRDQLEKAREAGVAVQKVILIGGFGDSTSLRCHLENVLSRERNLIGEHIQLMQPKYVDSAVARGAVLRALNKEHGPTRISRTSYGILFDDRFDKNNPKHKGLKGRKDKADGNLYIKETIHWQISKGDVVPANQVTRVLRRHIFQRNSRRLIVSEALWVSGQKHESGYRKNHANNDGEFISWCEGSSLTTQAVLTMSGAEQLGKIMFDLTELKSQPKKYLTTEDSSDHVEHTFWEIEFDLCLIIDGRNLRFEARSPENPNQVTSSQNFSIAASFIPGTA
ncbi:hypothetical protein H2200_006333 [Cladophialophora chaetospira]|uniref:Hsp70 family chaperone n=1 Tax=Cladophialophora chaetospira TaxID=386627 RepID=A0AA39CIE4_9EURO|nr:hypothetical protein H2200_006333 [Cladophialophora chaetospira]